MARVVLENVSKVYAGGTVAVDRACLSVEDREFVVLVGPSGCGKSTTLRMVAGLEAITSGAVSIDGRIVNDVPPKDRDVAMVFQSYALYPHMSVFDNLAFALKIRRLDRAEIRRRVEEAADVLGIRDLLQRRPRELSGGQRQRVAVGRAMVRRPKAFLFDEPLSNLDARMRVQMRAEILRLHERLGATMIYVTHDQVEAMTMGDRIVVMKDGRIQQAAMPMELYARPANAFVASFIGSPPMNLVRGRLEGAGAHLVFVAGLLRVPPGPASRERLAGREGQEILLGLRPEDLSLARPGEAGTEGLGEAAVELVEPTGAEAYVHLRAAEATLVARVPAGHAPHPGTTVRILADPARAHFFDPADGGAL
jgi:multiple sugar transport system ATP-binding protein